MIKLSNLLKETPDVGKVLFGSDKELAKLQGKSEEPNTDWEEKSMKMLSQWVEGDNASKTASYLKNNFEDFKVLSKKHPEILKAPIGKACYRGADFDQRKASQLRNISLKDNFTKTKIGGIWYLYSKKPFLSYKSHLPAQSWSLNFKTAQDFSKDSGFIMVSRVDSNFNFNPEALNNLSNRFMSVEEDETVRVSNSPLKTYCLIKWDAISNEEYIIWKTVEWGIIASDLKSKGKDVNDDYIIKKIFSLIEES